MKASSSFGRDLIRWRQSKTTGGTLRKTVEVGQFAQANIGVLAGYNPVLKPNSTNNHVEMKREVEEKQLHRMAKVHHVLEMWQGSQNLRATQTESHAQNKQMTPIGYISDTAEIFKESWSNF